MRIHHFYPRTNNIGDHFVQRGIESMVRATVPEATFQLFNVNSRGREKDDYGLTRCAVDRANQGADLVIVGGSNLYEGNYSWRWGVHLEPEALEHLRVPLFLIGIGSGSNFASQLHQPSSRAEKEIKLLNKYAAFSGARDVITLDWLRQLGISKAKLTGDPATFIFNRAQRPNHNDSEDNILITVPPLRFWTSKRQFWSVHMRGRAMFRALVTLARTLLEQGHKVKIACNDPMDLPMAGSLFDGWLPGPVVCPQTPEEYFRLLSSCRAVVTGRLHTACVAFSLGIPFLLMNVDQRTHGFIKTYQLDDWAVVPSRYGIESHLNRRTDKLLGHEVTRSWEPLIEKRNQMYARSMDLLHEALEPISRK
ncbi:MAG TPA: polysaccharide pyruvyl transferase family protein [Pyrinomonadaceae bacterium]|jgi:polysaccharide pyruvyl transferase WcaK-like protein